MKFKSQPDWQPRSNKRKDPYTSEGRTWVVSTPILSLAAKALREVVERAEGGKVSAQDKLRLAAEVCIEHHENINAVREDIFTGMEAENKRVEAILRKKEPLLEKLLKEIEKLRPEYTKLCVLVGMRPKDDYSCTWKEDEPMSLEEIAGTENLPGPHLVRDDAKSKGLFTRATIGGAGLLTIGILSLKGEDLQHVLDNPLPALLLFGLAYGTVNAIGHVLERIAEAAGDQLYRRGIAQPHVAVVTCWGFLTVFPLVFFTALATETLIDSVGFFKVVSDTHRDMFTGAGATQPNFAVLALMAMFVSFPILTLYSLGFHQGYYKANVLKLIAFLKKLRTPADPALRDSLAKLAEVSGMLMFQAAKATVLETEITELKSLIRYAENEEELRRLEDLGDRLRSANLEERQLMGLENSRIHTAIKEGPTRPRLNPLRLLFRK